MVEVDIKNPPARCPFCHDAVAVADRAVCAACVAVHHLECWTEHGRCSSCGSEQVLTMQARLVQEGPLSKRIEELQGDDSLGRRWAAYSLRHATPRDKAAVAALIKTLSDPDRWTQMWSAVALGQIGRASQKSAARLEAIAADEDSHDRVREAAREALTRIQGGKR